MTTSKSPNKVAIIAYAIAKQALPAYRHEFSPKKFTQHQLVAILVLKEFFKKDYRGIEEILKDSSVVVSPMGLMTMVCTQHGSTKNNVLGKMPNHC